MSATPNRYNLSQAQKGEGEDMSRRRLQKTGDLRADGQWWRLYWREDAVDADGKITRPRRSSIIGLQSEMTKKQAGRWAWENILSKVDTYSRTPMSAITLRQFVDNRFLPEYVWPLKHAGKEHYKYCLSKILPAFGNDKLRDILPGRISKLCRKLIDEDGLKVTTALKVKIAMSAIFEFAKECSLFFGENPARMVRLPESDGVSPDALTFEQATAALALMPSPVREMSLLSMCTSPNIAELCGLRLKRINLTDQSRIVDSVNLPPGSMLITENWYRNRPGTVKTKNRRRIVPIPGTLVADIAVIVDRDTFNSPDDYVFIGRTGSPIDAHNTNSRLFKRISKETGAKITWHVLRHSCATFAESVGMERSDRIALMGHGSGKMTDRYTHSDTERRRGAVEKIAAGLAAKPEPEVKQKGKVIEWRTPKSA